MKPISLYEKVRKNRYANLFVIQLRYLIGIGFLPSGLKKIINTPFANPGQEGAFFEYLDALFATGYYYQMIGWAQVIAAILLITQRFATLGAVLFFPIIFNIMIFTLSTIGSLTPVIATLMFFGISLLLIWDYYKWINIFSSDNQLLSIPYKNTYPTASKWWIKTGILLLVLPIIILLIIKFIIGESSQGIAFISFLLFCFLIPVVSFIIHEVRYRTKKISNNCISK